MATAFRYSRVSTDDQNLSPEWQAQVCTNHYEVSLKQKGYALHPEVFHDHGVSAFSVDWRDRPKGREMFNLVKPGDIILVAKMCRAFRSPRDRENCLHFFDKVGIDIVVLDAMMDTTTAAGKFAAGVIALQVAWESGVRSERMKAAHSVRRQRKTPMKKRPPPGWKLVGDELVPDWEERRIIAEVYALAAKGIRSIYVSQQMLTAQGKTRSNGRKYYRNFFPRAFQNFLDNFPREGYRITDAEVTGRYIRSQASRVFRLASEVVPASRP